VSTVSSRIIQTGCAPSWTALGPDGLSRVPPGPPSARNLLPPEFLVWHLCPLKIRSRGSLPMKFDRPSPPDPA
jgi:hypothetical protein